MTETLNWIMTADHKPTFEECEGKQLIFHRVDWDKNAWVARDVFSRNNYEFAFDNLRDEMSGGAIDRYILIDIPEFIPDPEPVPCKVCGGHVECNHDPAYTSDPNPYVIYCDGDNHLISFDAPTRAEAIQLWNKWNS